MYANICFLKRENKRTAIKYFVHALNIYGRTHKKVITLVACRKMNWEAGVRAISKRETLHYILFILLNFELSEYITFPQIFFHKNPIQQMLTASLFLPSTRCWMLPETMSSLSLSCELSRDSKDSTVFFT